jgi:hypothetical protein
MRSIVSTLKRSHAVYASVHSAAALIAMRVELLLGEDVAAALQSGLLETGQDVDLSRIGANLALE